MASDEHTATKEDDHDAAMAYMSQYFVALMCKCDFARPGGKFVSGYKFFSGFLLELHGMGFWVTAGHCLKDELDTPISEGKLKVKGGRFLDHFGHQVLHDGGIPFTYEPGCGFYIDDPELSLDFAVIQLNTLQSKAFLANNLKFISRNNWVSQSGLAFKTYKMLGLVDSPMVAVDGDNMTVETKQAMITVTKIAKDELGEPPHNAEPPADDWFFGRVAKASDVKSIVGMSGGPIYGFRYDEQGQLLYHVVALQSHWWDKTRAIFGCPLPLFAEQLHQYVGDYIAEFGVTATPDE